MGNRKLISEQFESISDFVNMLDLRPYNDNNTVRHGRSGETDDKFFGTKSYTEADELARFGDFKSFKKVSESCDFNGKVHDVARNRIVSHKSGGVVNIGAYMTGNPNNMIRLEKVRTEKYVKVLINHSVPYFIKTKDMIKASASVFDEIQKLKNSGAVVDVYSCIDLHDGSNKYDVSLRVKVISAGDRSVSLAKVAYFVVNPSFLRRHFFKWIETYPGLEGDYEGFGCCTHYNDQPGYISIWKICDMYNKGKSKEDVSRYIHSVIDKS